MKEKTVQTNRSKMIDEALELYLSFGGRKHQQIEDIMRSRGWPFSKKWLYASQNRRSRGWIVEFGWIALLKEEQRDWLVRLKEKRSRSFPGWLKAEFHGVELGVEVSAAYL